MIRLLTIILGLTVSMYALADSGQSSKPEPSDPLFKDQAKQVGNVNPKPAVEKADKPPEEKREVAFDGSSKSMTNEEIQAIVLPIIKAIAHQNSDIFKDYIFPIFSSFFSAIMGAAIAYFTLRHQEKIQIEKTKLDLCNKWTIEVDGLLQSLIAMKANYASEIGADPVARAIQVRTILSHSPPLMLNYAELSFLTPKKDDRNDQKNHKWRQISRFRAMIENYNIVIKLWDERNLLERPLKTALMRAAGPRAYAELTSAQVIEIIGERDVAVLVDLTESVVHLTDDLIIESSDFLRNFPDVVKAVVNVEKLKDYGTVLKFHLEDNQYVQNMIRRTPEVEFEKVAALLGLTVPEIKSKYCLYEPPFVV